MTMSQNLAQAIATYCYCICHPLHLPARVSMPKVSRREPYKCRLPAPRTKKKPAAAGADPTPRIQKKPAAAPIANPTRPTTTTAMDASGSSNIKDEGDENSESTDSSDSSDSATVRMWHCLDSFFEDWTAMEHCWITEMQVRRLLKLHEALYYMDLCLFKGHPFILLTAQGTYHYLFPQAFAQGEGYY